MERDLHDPRAEALRDLGRAVGAAGIGHHDLVGPQHARDRVRDLLGLVEGEDVGRYLLHMARSVDSEPAATAVDAMASHAAHARSSHSYRLRASEAEATTCPNSSPSSSRPIIARMRSTRSLSRAVASDRPRLRGRGRGRRLGPRDRRAGRALAAAPGRSARACLAGGPRAFAPPRSATARSSPPAATTASSSTAIALRGRISSRRIGELAEPGWFVTGNRVLLSRELTAAVLRDGLQPQTWSFVRMDRPAPARRRQSARRGAARCRSARCASCGRGNGAARAPAISRSGARDLDRVDGFDASFSGWGREDSDLLVRLLHAGVRRKDGRFATGVIHLWHPEADRAQLAANRGAARCGAAQRPHARPARHVAPARRRGR